MERMYIVEPELHEPLRHTGARSFVCSRAIADHETLRWRDLPEVLVDLVGRDADRSANPDVGFLPRLLTP